MSILLFVIENKVSTRKKSQPVKSAEVIATSFPCLSVFWIYFASANAVSLKLFVEYPYQINIIFVVSNKKASVLLSSL